MTTPVDPRELRVSDAERTHVVDVLQKAIGVGLLSLDDFTARADIALASRTRGELNAVLVDLPGLVSAEAPRPPEPEPVEIRTSMSTVRRRGAWDVPRALSVHNRAGTVELDFTEARITGPVVTVDVDVAMGSVELLIPDEATCDLHVDTAIGGTVTDRGARRATGGGTRFVVTGLVKAGSLTVRRPTVARIGPLVIGRHGKLTWADRPDRRRLG
ncbi:DUF1707 domain-containing protein [Actinokineospora sp. PR83]|uniref:DUF1707 SHOCT-like domain-containing protein n=1 Tax=Actinokineospora sp. PR83 TaxID=2884908 RepID=UPI0027E04AB3|nr:DUF1707 domain-containing protein [Actinokineospora sp. PR83]MCG8918000.1 DUF1707 domain-containing protein [Actinokineospora sp. PR83]